LASLAANAGAQQISNVGRPATTATQAVISYLAPDSNPCTVTVREKGEAALAHDVNPALFAGANQDLSRSSTIVTGARRVFVAGKRTAEAAADGMLYSRALQTDTEHEFTITCGSATHSGTFRTTNIPLGMSYLEGIPAGGARPGEPGWPTLKWADRQQKIIDPQTGVLLQRISAEADVLSLSVTNFAAADGPNWTNANGSLSDDASAASYSGSARDPLFLDYGGFQYYGGTHSAQARHINEMQVELNAWCQGGDCSSASADDRTLEFCLTIDRVSCVSPVKTLTLASCASSCTAATPHRYAIGDTLTGNLGYLPGWFGNETPPFDSTSQFQHFGTANRDGEKLYWTGGNNFDTKWTAGSKIVVNNVTYTIASVESYRELTLSGTPSGLENGAAFQGVNFGVIVRKKTTSSTPLVLQFARARVILGQGPLFWDASGAGDQYTNCGNALVTGPGDEPGWHCRISEELYWLGRDSGKVSLLGAPVIPPRGGVDGWPQLTCEALWDKNAADDFYCSGRDNGGKVIIVRSRYSGDNRDEAPITLYAPLKECGPNPQPCWMFTNVTPASQGLSIGEQVAALNPDFATFRNQGFRIVNTVGNASRFLLIANRDIYNQDALSYFAYFNASTGAVDAAIPTWKHYPLRWTVAHGTLDIGDNSWIHLPQTFFRGPFTGYDYSAGNGPYYSRVASGAIGAQGEACPSRPPGSPIPAGQWPSGNVCLTITVDGEPGDPSPKVTTAGSVSVSGAVVTVAGGSFPVEANGLKMKIDGVYYVFTWTSSTTGTLSPQPGAAIANRPYILFLEDVDDPRTGPARRDFAYLQDAEVRDVYCGVNAPSGGGTNGCGFTFQNEYFRLLIKSGNTWTLERGYTKNPLREQFFALNANAYLIAVPAACDMKLYPCAKSGARVNLDIDPLGQNLNGTTVEETGSNGAGHTVVRPVGEVNAVAFDGCPLVDGLGYSCYNSRYGNNTLETMTTERNIVFSGQPPFRKLLGVGVPNAVDSHPSMPGPLHPMHTQPGGGPRWFLDGRVFDGGDFTGAPSNEAVRLTGDLFRVTSAQLPRLRRKILPTFAYCGSRILTDISGPGSSLGGGSGDAYKYCVAEQGGECRPGSQTGEVYFNCPQLGHRYCYTGIIGAQQSDTDDVCIADHASYTMSAIQMGFDKPNMAGLYGRSITKQLSRPRYADVFWNVKTTPDGKWMLFRTMWANGFAHATLMAKLPPFPGKDSINRADFLPVAVNVAASPDPTETRAFVEFGYNPDLQCTSRAETCVKGGGSNVFTFAFENETGVACASGCRIDIPALPQRVLYYRVVRQKAANVRGSVGNVEVRATP
jgi:hypothetical protein